MSLIQARTTSINVYRGTSRDIRVEVLDERGDPYPVEHETPILRVSRSWVDSESTFELEGVIVDGETGKIRFELEPYHTEELVSRGYDFVILLQTQYDEEWPVYIGRLGIEGVPAGGESG